MTRQRQDAYVCPGKLFGVADAAVDDDPGQPPGCGDVRELVSHEGASPGASSIHDEDTPRREIFQRLPDEHIVLEDPYRGDRPVETRHPAVGYKHGFAHLYAPGEVVADVRRLDVRTLAQRIPPIVACQKSSISPGTNGR